MFQNIEAELARRKMTRLDLGKMLGVSSKTISNWMVGKAEIPAGALVRMAHEWKCSADYLLGLSEHATEKSAS